MTSLTADQVLSQVLNTNDMTLRTSIAVSQLTVTGTASPSTAPARLYTFFLDTSTNNIYFAVGTSTSSDWVLLNGASSGGGGGSGVSVTRQAGSPSINPPSVGAFYINTTTNDVYIANGTTSTTNWVLLTATSSGGGSSVDAATQSEVNAGVINNEYVSPLTLNGAINNIIVDMLRSASSTQDGLVTLSNTSQALNLATGDNVITSTLLRLAIRNFTANQYGDLTANAVATTNQNLSSFRGPLDGVTLQNGSEVLFVGQTNTSQNGLYILTSSGFVRSSDSNNTARLSGSTVSILDGTVGGGRRYRSNVSLTGSGLDHATLPHTITYTRISFEAFEHFTNQIGHDASFTYNSDGQITSMVRNSVTTNFTYNSSGRITARDTIYRGLNYRQNFVYDASGRITSYTYNF